MRVLSVPRTWLKKRTVWSRVLLWGKSLPNARIEGGSLLRTSWWTSSASCLDAATMMIELLDEDE
jgi:hypothetical protein